MDTAIVITIIVVLAGLWLLWKKRGKSQPNEHTELSFEEDGNYELLEINDSETSEAKYDLLRNDITGQILCTCRGFTSTKSEDGCKHTKDYIGRNATDENGQPTAIEKPGQTSKSKTNAGASSKKKAQAAGRQAVKIVERWADSDYLVLDTETTGRSGKSKVIEIAVMDKDGNLLLNTLVNPGRSPITAQSAEIHGITRKDVAGKPTFTEVWPELKVILEDHELLLTYNADFDIRLMEQSLEDDEAQRTLRNVRTECIMKTYTNWWKSQSRANDATSFRSLQKAAEDCRITPEEKAHRAAQDCDTARQVVQHMISTVGTK